MKNQDPQILVCPCNEGKMFDIWVVGITEPWGKAIKSYGMVWNKDHLAFHVRVRPLTKKPLVRRLKKLLDSELPESSKSSKPKVRTSKSSSASNSLTSKTEEKEKSIEKKKSERKKRENVADYEHMKVPQLRKELKRRGLVATGRKADMIMRLEEDDEEEEGTEDSCADEPEV